MIIKSVMRLIQGMGRPYTGDSEEKERRVRLYQLVQSGLSAQLGKDEPEQEHREFT